MLIALAGLLISGIGALVPLLILNALPPDEAGQNTYVGLPVQYLSMFVLGVIAVRLIRSRTWQPDDLGLTRPRAWSDWALGVAGAVAFVVIAQVATQLSKGLGEAGAQVSNQVGLGQGVVRDLTVIFAMAVAAPLGEELVYRGMIFRGLHDAMSAAGGVVAKLAFIVPALFSSMIFAISHGGEGQSRQFVFLTLFGLIVAFLYWWTGSLVVAVFCHSVTNMINVFLLTPATGLSHPGVWVFVVLTPVISLAILMLTRSLLGREKTSWQR